MAAPSRTQRTIGVDSALARRRGSQEPVGGIIAGRGNEILTPLLPNRPDHSRFRKIEGETFIHVSDVLYKCSRKIALSHLYNIAIIENPIFASQSLTFRIGEAVHNHVSNKVSENNPDMIYARWTCKCDTASYVGTLAKARKQPPCESCFTPPAHNYHEIEVVNRDLNVIGSPDLLLLQASAIYVNEIKSMAARQWDELERPVPDHIIQVLFYWYLMSQANYRLHDYVSILYVCKDFRPRTPYKEFTIQAVDNLPRLDPYIEEARNIARSLKGGELPERRLCHTTNDTEAKKCEVCMICFGAD